MEAHLLSLKNIYRMLTIKDYPVCSEGVIRERYLRGQTLIRFWTGSLENAVRTTQHGRMIWRTEGSRNRFHSELCNRRPNFPYYKIYTQELSAILTPDLVHHQVLALTDFLKKNGYSHETFLAQSEEFLKLAAAEDEAVSASVAEWFLYKIDAIRRSDGVVPFSYLDGWLLTMMSLHAITGPHMNDEEFSRLRSNRDYQPLFLYRFAAAPVYSVPSESHIEYLSGEVEDILGTGVDPDYFFGRQHELYDLAEDIRSGSNVLITGKSGTGKTELLRQYLRSNRIDSKIRYICVVRYGSKPDNGFLRSMALPMKEALDRIAMLPKEETLLCIDDLNLPADDEIWQEFLKIGCRLIVTSVRKPPEGFRIVKLETLGDEASSLILRSNYGRVLTPDERRALRIFAVDTGQCHPLTLRLLGRTAAVNGWTPANLAARANQSVRKYPAWEEAAKRHTQDRYQMQLSRIFIRMYSRSGMNYAEQKILQLFSMLPYVGYSTGFIFRCLGISDDPSQEQTELLNGLEKRGWLEHYRDTYAMHPAIATWLRVDPDADTELASFQAYIKNRLDTIEDTDFARAEATALRIIRDYVLEEIRKKKAGVIPRQISD